MTDSPASPTIGRAAMVGLAREMAFNVSWVAGRWDAAELYASIRSTHPTNCLKAYGRLLGNPYNGPPETNSYVQVVSKFVNLRLAPLPLILGDL